MNTRFNCVPLLLALYIQKDCRLKGRQGSQSLRHSPVLLFLPVYAGIPAGFRRFSECDLHVRPGQICGAWHLSGGNGRGRRIPRIGQETAIPC